jgi:hypothetical protein
MSACSIYGNSAEDRYRERQLDAYLESQEDNEASDDIPESVHKLIAGYRKVVAALESGDWSCGAHSKNEEGWMRVKLELVEGAMADLEDFEYDVKELDL